MKNARNSRQADQIIREAIVQLFALRLATYGRVNDLKKFAANCVEQAVASAAVQSSKAGGVDFHCIASVLRAWHRETKYLSKDGTPKPLPLNGAGGLRALAARFYPPSRLDTLLRDLKRAKLIEQRGRGKWIPGGKHAVLPYISPEMLEHIADGVSRFVETVAHNVSSPKSESTLFERASKVRNFPSSELPQFREFVKTQASAFLGTVDEWAEARAESAQNRRTRKCTVGAFTFACIEEDRSPTKSR